MNCLKCGKEIAENQVFCDDCLQTMDNFPVEPGAPVVIIPRAEPRAEQRRKQKGYADTVRSMRKLIRRLCVALGIAVLLILILGGCLFHVLQNREQGAAIGQNYTTVENTSQP